MSREDIEEQFKRIDTMKERMIVARAIRDTAELAAAEKQVLEEFSALIDDEIRAYREYTRMAQSAREAEMYRTAKLFSDIAEVEKIHAKRLMVEAEMLGMTTIFFKKELEERP